MSSKDEPQNLLELTIYLIENLNKLHTLLINNMLYKDFMYALIGELLYLKNYRKKDYNSIFALLNDSALNDVFNIIMTNANIIEINNKIIIEKKNINGDEND